MSQQTPSWDFNRFIQTLSYFGAIPFLSNCQWFQHWFGSRPHPTVDTATLFSSETMNPRPIFDFTQSSSDLKEVWGALDDVVMGGVSESAIRFRENRAEFSGNVSTANSGGFASVRTRNFEPAIDLSRYEGIALRVKGDGNRYKFMLRTETRWDGVAYCRSFDTVAESWMTVHIPFQELVPVLRAKTVGDRSFDPSCVNAVQLMLSKFEYDGALNPHFQPGAFQLQIEWIGGY
jgi:Complex I intermediate-associated protein 30 (CIA30)